MPIRDAIRDQMNRYSRDPPRPEDTYLSYHDVCLTREDMCCLKDDWLTDNNISFWEEYLEHEELEKYPGSAVILLRPSMVHLLKSHKNPRELLAVLPDLRKASHVFMPINDCRDLEKAEGGSHWSLLVVDTTDLIAFHYDSLSPSNNIEAQIVHTKLETLLGFNLHLVHLNDTPQQENGSDCGVHVCWAMKHLLVRRLLIAERQQEVDMSLGGKRLDASRMRREMYRICESLRKKASRSVSPMSRIRGDKESPPRIGIGSYIRA